MIDETLGATIELQSGPENTPTGAVSSSMPQTSAGGESMVVGIVGPRGSGKTLLLCDLCLTDMSRERKVPCNLKIKGPVHTWKGVRNVETLDLNYIQLITMAEELRNATVAIDEINMLFDAYAFQTMGSKLFNSFMQQLRKRGNALYYTTQNYKWVDNRIRWQTDLLIHCTDMFHTPIGRENSLERGELISFTIQDKSGYVTGRPYDRDENPQLFFGKLLGKPLWPFYDTEYVINPFEGMVQVNLMKRKMTMDVSQWGAGEGAAQQGQLLSSSSEPEPEQIDIATKKSFMQRTLGKEG